MAQSVTIVKKGDSVPFDGVLFPKQKEAEFRTDLQTAEKKVITLTKLNELNEKEISVLTQRLDIYQTKTKDMLELQSKLEQTTFLKSAVYFLSGAILTGVIGYGVVKAYR
jgi:hypothetical protein